MASIDLNADLGEGYGAWSFGQDEALMRSITSANIACGWHAGDPATMRASVLGCLKAGVAIGAHPGLPDRLGFGRREMALSPDEIYDGVLYQLGALEAFVRASGGRLRHMKPHGALYHMCNQSEAAAEAVARAAADLRCGLAVFAQAGSLLLEAAARHGLPAVAEAFADRAYTASGKLAERSLPGAVLHDPDAVLAQALGIASRGEAGTLEGPVLSLSAATICLHGDRPGAAEAAMLLRRGLEEAGVRVAAPDIGGPAGDGHDGGGGTGKRHER
ncbi:MULTISPECIES: LamB/YcsF family protein [Paenibacillus]|uniref:LamB/YcsF family protein n=1 Tax=Paenibacillus TaxID=44249 RepID=UPI00065F825A|nr:MULTISPECIES: 5-oxoprolinase subunit PxpA [Paenibacillus]